MTATITNQYFLSSENMLWNQSGIYTNLPQANSSRSENCGTEYKRSQFHPTRQSLQFGYRRRNCLHFRQRLRLWFAVRIHVNGKLRVTL